MIHRLLHGHWAEWHVSGYDGLEVHFACMVCEPDRDWSLWHSVHCACDVTCTVTYGGSADDSQVGPTPLT